MLIDYVKSDSRGRAAGLRLFGTFFGEIFCQAVLVGLTSKMSFAASFHLVSIFLAVMVVPLIWMVKDSHEVEKIDNDVKYSSKWEKIKAITSQVVTECKNDAKYPVCLFAYMVHSPIIPLFSMTGILWIASFIDAGKVANDLEAK